MKDKIKILFDFITKFKDLSAIGISYTLATAISGIFWIAIAPLLGTEGYGEIG